MSVGVHENRPSEGPFYRVCGKVHAGMTLLMLLSASVSRTATEQTLFMLAQYIYSIVQLTRQYSSRRSSTELHDSCFTKRASSSGAVGLQSASIDRPSSAAVGSMTGMIPSILVHRARSHDHFRSSQLSQRRCCPLRRASQPAAQFWPERLRSHFEPLGTRYRTYLGMVRRRARPDRSKWLHGSPAES